MIYGWRRRHVIGRCVDSHMAPVVADANGECQYSEEYSGSDPPPHGIGSTCIWIEPPQRIIVGVVEWIIGVVIIRHDGSPSVVSSTTTKTRRLAFRFLLAPELPGTSQRNAVCFSPQVCYFEPGLLFNKLFLVFLFYDCYNWQKPVDRATWPPST
jgi:hypothetical protein